MLRGVNESNRIEFGIVRVRLFIFKIIRVRLCSLRILKYLFVFVFINEHKRTLTEHVHELFTERSVHLHP